MRNFKNNFRRNRYKNHNDRSNHKNVNGNNIIKELQNGSNFLRKNPSRNNGKASKLIEKYSNLAREALSNGDKILSENYFQHAEHFIRVLGEKEALNGKVQPSQSSDKNIKNSTQGEAGKEEKNLIDSDSNSSGKNLITES